MTMGTRIVVMKDGLIQQVDAPKKLYDRPNNMFVAGFIGSPQMNFIDVDVTEDRGNIILVMTDERKLNLSEAQQQVLKSGSYIGKRVVLGIRPEHLHDASIDALNSGYNEIKTNVDVTELMGAELYVHAEIASIPMVARVSGQSEVKAFDEIRLQFHYDKMHLFDKKTEKVIR
jgi:multiple sugar transport system ATP-binding protein